MAFDLIVEPATCDIPSVADLETQWANVPNVDVRKVIAREHQYLRLQALLLDRMYYTAAGGAADPQYKNPVDYTLRAGAIKATILIAASICEAALRSHGEKRGLPLNANPRRRTFGNILSAWSGQADVSAIYADLEAIKDFRNNVHLFVTVTSADADYMAVLKNEQAMLDKARNAIAEIMKLKSP